jgi:FdhD protein
MYHHSSMPDPSTLPLTVTTVNGSRRFSHEDVLAVEEPLEIRLGTLSGNQRIYTGLSVTMRTPGNDTELAAGFLFTEGIVSTPSEINSIEAWGPLSGEALCRNIVKVDLAAGVRFDLARVQRHFYTTSSCGICGKASLEAVRSEALGRGELPEIEVDSEVIWQLPAKLRDVQSNFDLTGGLHAAALFTPAGELIAIREDVGRHNAVDKLIGSQILSGNPDFAAILLVSGRAGFELVQKAAAARIPVMAAVGAPSTLAVELAAEFDMTLIGFLRDDRFNIYSGEARIR